MRLYLERIAQWFRRKTAGRMGYVVALAALIFALLLGTGC